ncbi:MAG TPA: hypothetical protein VFZ66_16785 [Herpetosiphonaceae bacterium]
MRRSYRFLVPLFGALLLLLSAFPASAHDPDDGHDHEDHSGPGSTGPDVHSQNLKILATSPRPTRVTQSDLAFDGRIAYAGTYDGFRVIDISDPENPVQLLHYVCPGSQGDVSFYHGLLFVSIDGPRSNDSCSSTAVSASTPGAWEGLRIFDVRDPINPQYIAAIRTDCGSHTNTLVPDPANSRVLIYVSSYPLGTAAIGPNCQVPHGFISIVDVPLSSPASASVSKYYLDPATELGNFLSGGRPYDFTACHDISVFTELNLAAAACMSEAQIWDISDPANPVFLRRFDDPVINTRNSDLWHSAAFSWDGRVVAFGDESGGGSAARCATPNDLRGRIWFLDLESWTLQGTFKIPRVVTTSCTMHNFNFIPLTGGRKVLVSSAYSGGTTVIDVDKLIAGATPAEAEIGYYQSGGGSVWSSYWYNGFIYGQGNRGLDVMLLSDNARAGARKFSYMNPQTQETVIP